MPIIHLLKSDTLYFFFYLFIDTINATVHKHPQNKLILAITYITAAINIGYKLNRLSLSYKRTKMWLVMSPRMINDNVLE